MHVELVVPLLRMHGHACQRQVAGIAAEASGRHCCRGKSRIAASIETEALQHFLATVNECRLSVFTLWSGTLWSST